MAVEIIKMLSSKRKKHTNIGPGGTWWGVHRAGEGQRQEGRGRR